MIPVLLRDLGRNVALGGRVPFGLSVRRLEFRVGVPQLLTLFVFSALVDLALDWVQRETRRSPTSPSRPGPARSRPARPPHGQDGEVQPAVADRGELGPTAEYPGWDAFPRFAAR